MTNSLQLISFILFTILPKATNDSIVKPPPLVYTKMQYAGNIGLVSAGIGTFIFNDKMSIDLSYGYLPRSINGAEVNTIALKPCFHFLELQNNFKWDFYTGLSINYSITKNTYLKYPDHFPKGYYRTNALHFNPLLGIRFFPNLKAKFNSFSIYSEIGSVDYKILNSIVNEKINITEIWNVCFGLIFPIS